MSETAFWRLLGNRSALKAAVTFLQRPSERGADRVGSGSRRTKWPFPPRGGVRGTSTNVSANGLSSSGALSAIDIAGMAAFDLYLALGNYAGIL